MANTLMNVIAVYNQVDLMRSLMGALDKSLILYMEVARNNGSHLRGE